MVTVEDEDKIDLEVHSGQPRSSVWPLIKEWPAWWIQAPGPAVLLGDLAIPSQVTRAL